MAGLRQIHTQEDIMNTHKRLSELARRFAETCDGSLDPEKTISVEILTFLWQHNNNQLQQQRIINRLHILIDAVYEYSVLEKYYWLFAQALIRAGTSNLRGDSENPKLPLSHVVKRARDLLRKVDPKNPDDWVLQIVTNEAKALSIRIPELLDDWRKLAIRIANA
jgi:hypothetical protein